jgi:hypothetical protein
VSEVRTGELEEGGSCEPPDAAREFGLVDVRSCGKGPPRHFRIVGLVADGIRGLEIEKAGGKPKRAAAVEACAATQKALCLVPGSQPPKTYTEAFERRPVAKMVMPIAAAITEPPRIPSFAAPTRSGSS